MPVPKRRHSRTRSRKRRTHYKVDKPAMSICPECKKPKPPHRICPHCGYYRGKEVISTEK